MARIGASPFVISNAVSGDIVERMLASSMVDPTPKRKSLLIVCTEYYLVYSSSSIAVDLVQELETSP